MVKRLGTLTNLFRIAECIDGMDLDDFVAYTEKLRAVVPPNHWEDVDILLQWATAIRTLRPIVKTIAERGEKNAQWMRNANTN